MQVNRCLAALMIVGIISGCHPPVSSPGQVANPRATSSKPESAPVGGPIIAGLSKGMAYADLRRLALQSGWAPVVDPDCKSNVMGPNYEELCKSDTSEFCAVCNQLPEVSGCSGDGYCGMYFSSGQQRLHVVTYGMIEDWNVSGVTSRLNVDGWDFSKANPITDRN